ncbi:hypothetical protein [Humibacter ginsenosidimutans]|uniref:DUF3168 domain-containing protein n=1 Tax=Humibacter ginsenosidimutans TaxID=2599293 RepID=A0A5B8M496_9MICO|nr:hypothetical protein [Humibacter ginsenosidimutans]QDZ14764.1 hypothetical protein FPZ11_08335 [Humibacter ginsenosidimutans]
MSSDTIAASRLDNVRATLDAVLKPVLPADWKTVPNIDTPQAKQLVPVLYTEFTGISSDYNGQTLPQGTVFCDFDLVVSVASTDNKKGEDDADKAVLDLIVAVDQADQVAWSTAKKQRMETGQLVWRVSLAVLTSTN